MSYLLFKYLPISILFCLIHGSQADSAEDQFYNSTRNISRFEVCSSLLISKQALTYLIYSQKSKFYYAIEEHPDEFIESFDQAARKVNVNWRFNEVFHYYYDCMRTKDEQALRHLKVLAYCSELVDEEVRIPIYMEMGKYMNDFDSGVFYMSEILGDHYTYQERYQHFLDCMVERHRNLMPSDS